MEEIGGEVVKKEILKGAFGGRILTNHKVDSEFFGKVFDDNYKEQYQSMGKTEEELLKVRKRFIDLETKREKKHYKAYRNGLTVYTFAGRHFPVLRKGDIYTPNIEEE